MISDLLKYKYNIPSYVRSNNNDSYYISSIILILALLSLFIPTKILTKLPCKLQRIILATTCSTLLINHFVFDIINKKLNYIGYFIKLLENVFCVATIAI